MKPRTAARLHARVTFCAALGLAAPVAAQPVTPRPGLRPVGLLEVDARRYSSISEGFDGLSVRRARLGLRGSIAPWCQFQVVSELGRGAPSLLDAFVSLTPTPSVEINVGYLRMPNLLSGRDVRVFALPIPERAMTVVALGAFRDVGVEVHARPRRWPVEAWVRVGNGSGNPGGPEIGTPLVAARVDLVLGRAHPHAPSLKRWGVRLGTALSASVVPERGGIAGTTPLGFPFVRPEPIEGARWAWTGHLQVQLGALQWTTEGGLARDGRSRDDDGNPNTPRAPLPAVTTWGVVTELAWMMRGPARHGDGWPLDGPSAASLGPLGAWEVAVRAERLSLNEGAADLTPGGVWGGAAAVRWWANEWAALTLAAYLHRYDRPPLEAPDDARSSTLLLRGTVRLP